MQNLEDCAAGRLFEKCGESAQRLARGHTGEIDVVFQAGDGSQILWSRSEPHVLIDLQFAVWD